MTREEAIVDIRDNIKPVVGGKSLDMAIKALEKEDILEKIRSEIMMKDGLEEVLEIIDKYREVRGMTREEAIEILKYLIPIPYRGDGKSTTHLMQTNALIMAIKALEQENVLDEMFENIKTEIDFIPTYGAKFADGSINVHVSKEDVLQIIDKYRGE